MGFRGNKAATYWLLCMISNSENPQFEAGTKTLKWRKSYHHYHLLSCARDPFEASKLHKAQIKRSKSHNLQSGKEEDGTKNRS